MGRQTMREWIIRYNKYGVAGLAGNWNGERPPLLTLEELAERIVVVMAGPDPEKEGFSAFTRDDLVAFAKTKFGETMHPASMGRLLRRYSLSRQKTRPTHSMKDPATKVDFKKSPEHTELTAAYAPKYAAAVVLPGRCAHRAEGPTLPHLVEAR